MELAKLVLTSTENTIESPKNGQKSNDGKKLAGQKSFSKAFSSQSLKDVGVSAKDQSGTDSKVMIAPRVESGKSNKAPQS